ncbi:MAG: hypothetical protein WDZ51_13545 [Pirellulaceae bacterium]
MIRLPFFMSLLCLLPLLSAAADEQLPTTSEKQPLAADHFPTPAHAVVWRNWGLLPAERLAAVLETSPENIIATATGMGLPESVAAGSPQWDTQGYISIIRRNWHLLPYEQLLTLLNMSESQLAFSLREDDFLYIKLGSLKPHCPLVIWQPPTEAQAARAAEIREVVQAHFSEESLVDAQPRFAFAEHLESGPELPQPEKQPAESGDQDAAPRFLYSYFGTFGDPLADDAADPYPDALLKRLADHGVNGVWLHVVLRQLAPPSELFPEFGEGHRERLAKLRQLARRAQGHGIKIYLYMNEPRAMPLNFFESRQELQGTVKGGDAALCTSVPAVRRWLSDSIESVFTAVPNLGGIFTITASENFTHCASSFNEAGCPRCQHRTPAEIIAELNAALAEGVHKAAPEAHVFCWDWGWARHGLAIDHIEAMPENTWLMSVSEWALPIDRGGVKTVIGEYSISGVGPGPRATTHWQAAQKRGLKTLAKLQVNNTWELSAVPYLPVLDLVAEHMENLVAHQVDGAMLSWSLGGYPSPNLAIAQQFFDHPETTKEEALEQVARRYYGEAAPHVRAAWSKMSEGFRELPFNNSYLYRGPQQVGPANLLYDRPTGYASTMVCFPYDDLNAWRGPYPADIFISQFDKLVALWKEGETELAQGLNLSSAVAETLRIAQAARLHFESTANQSRYIQARGAGDSATMQRMLRQEIETAKQLHLLAREDCRIGYEATNHYYYVPQDLVEKVVRCEFQLR